MELKVCGWECSGFRCPDVKIDLDNDKSIKLVSLLQMPNGTGKTTTLDLLRATLTGEAVDWTPSKIKSYRRSGEVHATGTFILRLHFSQPIVLELTLDYEAEKAIYKTSRPGSGGLEPGHQPPASLKRFLSNDFVNLFFFDGEFAESLFKDHEASADKAIETVCGLYIFKLVHDTITKSWTIATSATQGGEQSEIALKRKRTLRDSIRTQLSKKKAEKEALQKENKSHHDLVTKRSGELDKLESGNEKVKQEREEWRQQINIHENELTSLSARLFSEIRNPYKLGAPIREGLRTLKDNFDRLKLPETTTRQFFTELAESDVCVCGRSIGDSEKIHILQTADKYMGQETAGVINAIKRDIGDRVDCDSEIASIKSDIIATEIALREARTHEQIAADTFSDELGEQHKNLTQEISNLNSEIKQNNDRIDTLDDSELEESIPSLAKKVKSLNDDIAELCDSLDDKTKNELLRKILYSARDIAKDRLEREVVESCNEKIENVLQQDPVLVSHIDKSLHLQHGQSNASVGQTLSIGYCFLTTLLERGNNNFPLVVDSPCGSLDDARRTQIASLIPTICSQFVAFIIKTECNYFVDPLAKSSADNIQYLTIFRKGPTTRQLEADASPDTIHSSTNGMVVNGRDFFDQFSFVDMGD